MFRDMFTPKVVVMPIRPVDPNKEDDALDMGFRMAHRRYTLLRWRPTEATGAQIVPMPIRANECHMNKISLHRRLENLESRVKKPSHVHLYWVSAQLRMLIACSKTAGCEEWEKIQSERRA